MRNRKRLVPWLLLSLGSFSLPGLAQDGVQAPDLKVALYDDAGRLSLPADIDRWILMGANLGGDYAEAGFDPANPGKIGVVQMEPAAYDYFLRHGEYADGSMLLLSFYTSEAKSRPQLQGFVQGDMTAREIHVIDKQRFQEGRAFFFYNPGESQAAALPPGNDCLRCHVDEGDFDGTFTQFYPPAQARLAAPSPHP